LVRWSYVPWNDDLLVGGGVYGVRMVNETSFALGQYEEMKSLSLDPYVAFRNGYFQLRQKRSGNKKVDN
jgi:phospholipid-binding lipoprotein MlaA